VTPLATRPLKEERFSYLAHRAHKCFSFLPSIPRRGWQAARPNTPRLGGASTSRTAAPTVDAMHFVRSLMRTILATNDNSRARGERTRSLRAIAPHTHQSEIWWRRSGQSDDHIRSGPVKCTLLTSINKFICRFWMLVLPAARRSSPGLAGAPLRCESGSVSSQI
jgi:hypothetical protein